MMLRSAINITHIPEEQVAYRQCTRPSLPPAKAWLREASLLCATAYRAWLSKQLKHGSSWPRTSDGGKHPYPGSGLAENPLEGGASQD